MRSLVSFPTYMAQGSLRRLSVMVLTGKTLAYKILAYLRSPFIEKEIREAVFEMGCLKSPGPHGMTGEFYKKSWNILKSDLVIVRMFQDFFKNGIINRRCNETYVCLIPKKKEVARVSDFKPKSLVTSLHKVISKVLATRLLWCIWKERNSRIF